MKLELGYDVLRSYKRLPYQPWYALAEFVDNSTQSYFNNKEALEAAYTREGRRLEVHITYDREGDGLIRVSDDAMGMDYEELTRALHVGLPPTYAEGRSRYGLGMKMAACWFGNQWTIVTKRLGSSSEYTVRVDVERVASGEADLEESVVNDLEPTEHYTRIEITQLNRRPHGRTLGKIKEFLASMYRLDIDRGDLVLTWQHEALRWEMDWVFLTDTIGAEYRKTFEFLANGKRVWGWVGVLDSGGRPKAGFAIVHQGRMIRTWPDAWHPESLFGQLQGSNDLVNQRLVGEINLDEFDVNHTKDDIHWEGDEEDEVQRHLREACSEYREVARTRRKRPVLNQVAIQAAARALEQELRSPEMQDLIGEEPPAVEVIAADTRALLEETDFSKLDFTGQYTYAGRATAILGVLDSTKSSNDPYVIAEAAQPNRVVVVINMQHPYLAEIDENGLLDYFRQCTYDALAEWKARNQATDIEPNTIRRLKDQLLRIGIQIEMRQND